MRDLVTFASIFSAFFELKNIVLRDPDDFARTNGAKSLFKSLANLSIRKTGRKPAFLIPVRDERLELPTFAV